MFAYYDLIILIKNCENNYLEKIEISIILIKNSIHLKILDRVSMEQHPEYEFFQF